MKNTVLFYTFAFLAAADTYLVFKVIEPALCAGFGVLFALEAIYHAMLSASKQT